MYQQYSTFAPCSARARAVAEPMLTTLEEPVTMASWPSRYFSFDMSEFLFLLFFFFFLRAACIVYGGQVEV